MNFFLLIGCVLLVASSAFATDATKDDLRKDVRALARIMNGEVKKSEAMYMEIADGVFGAVNRLYRQSLESIETIKNLNGTSLSIWRTRATFANISIFECLFDLQDLWVAQRDTDDEIRILINDAWADEVRANRDLSETVNATILDQIIILDDKINACDDDDDICLDLVELQIQSDWERLPSIVANGLKVAAKWFTYNTVLEDVRDLVRKYKANAEQIVDKAIICIKQKLEE